MISLCSSSCYCCDKSNKIKSRSLGKMKSCRSSSSCFWCECLLSKGRSRSSPPYLCPVGIGLEEDRTDTSFTSVSSGDRSFSSSYEHDSSHVLKQFLVMLFTPSIVAWELVWVKKNTTGHYIHHDMYEWATIIGVKVVPCMEVKDNKHWPLDYYLSTWHHNGYKRPNLML